MSFRTPSIHTCFLGISCRGGFGRSKVCVATVVSIFADAWEEHQQQCKLQGDDTSPGCTESPSNLMRAALKPGQGRDARFDKVVVMRERVQVQSAELVGVEQCEEVEKDDGKMLPLFPSDHFGVLVVAEDLARP